MHPCTFDRTDVHKDILTAVVRLDEAEAFLSVEPLHRTLHHTALLSTYVCIRPRQHGRFIRDLEEGRQSGAARGEAVRPKLDRRNVAGAHARVASYSQAAGSKADLSHHTGAHFGLGVLGMGDAKPTRLTIGGPTSRAD
jgi:hypothetical protein